MDYDLVIVTMLAHQVEAILPILQRSAARCIQFMFNTFDPELLRASVGIDRCVLGMPFVQALLDDDGRLKATIGAGGQRTIMDREASVELFQAAGLTAAFEPRMTRWLRSQAPMFVAFESVSVASVRRGAGASWSEAYALARGVHAGCALARHLDGDVYPRSKRLMARSPVAGVAAILWTVSPHPRISGVAHDGEGGMHRVGGRHGGGRGASETPDRRRRDRGDEAVVMIGMSAKLMAITLRKRSDRTVHARANERQGGISASDRGRRAPTATAKVSGNSGSTAATRSRSTVAKPPAL